MKESCLIRKTKELTEHEFSCLFLLYRPLVGNEGILLYGILRSLDGEVSLQTIRELGGFNTNRMEKARKQLEQFQLLKTYYHPQKEHWIFELNNPLEAQAFLRHDTFSRMYMQAVGSTQFDWVKTQLNSCEDVPSGYQDVSKRVDVSSLNQWDQTSELTYEQVRPAMEDTLRLSSFDFETFLRGMDNIFPARLRTEQNLARIAQLASIHGIDENKMRLFVSRSTNPNTHAFDFDKLQGLIYRSKPSQVPEPNSRYDMAPVQFLQQAQNGAPVAKADKKLIEMLCEEYGFSNEVVNVLIEFTLKNTDQNFPRQYVEKVAASWARKNVHDLDSALKATETKETQQKPTANSDWYEDRQTQEASDDLIRQGIEAQKRRKGGSDGEN